MGQVYSRIYEDFKGLCSEGRQPGTFAAYCRERSVSYARMHHYMKDHGLRVAGLPGYSLVPMNKGGCLEVPFEDVIFEEAGFLPADGGNVITVKVDGHVSVSFPADTDIAVVAGFVKKLGKEAGHVGA